MRKVEKKKLDEIGKLMVTADALSSRDIESITGNPALFDSVRARIKLTALEPARRRYLPGRGLVGAFASIALVASVIASLAVFGPVPNDLVAVPITPESPRKQVPKKFGQPDKVVSTNLPPAPPAPLRVERVSTKPEVKITRPRESSAHQIRYEEDFYALSYAGDPSETERGGRIVRMDIPRSTLFAMGVDVPLENESETVKADLIIGSDGVTRAIRVVK